MSSKDSEKMDGLYINDFHRSNSMAAQREVLCMSLHLYSREQKVRQVERLHEGSTFLHSTVDEHNIIRI